MSQNGDTKKTTIDGEQMQRIQALSALTSRLNLAQRMGFSHKGNRDLYDTLGYPSKVSADELISQWKRQGIARAVVDRPVKKTWQGEFTITEPGDEDETELEKAFKALDEKLELKSRLMRVDRLAQLGEYAVLLLGFDDSSKETWSQPVEQGERELRYARPISKNNATITDYENEPSNPRYGKPRIYEIDLNKAADGQENKASIDPFKVHHTRIIHVAFNLLEDDVEGEPIMKSIYNRLKDLEKLIGGSAEMFWRGARPGYFGSAKEDYKVDDKMKEDFKEQVDEYEHDLRRILIGEGLDVESLAQQVADPQGHVNAQLQMISAVTGIPLRILVGSERGELASSQDEQNWKEFIQTRRTEEAEPEILRPFIDRLIEYKALPEPQSKAEGYSVVWSDLFTLGEKERADVGQARADALSKYSGQFPAEQFVPLEAFLKYFLHMDEDQVTQILEIRKAEIEDGLAEEAEFDELEREMRRVDEDQDDEE